MKWIDALWVGLAQALALLPGISRSGATISGGMLRQFDRRSAARYSFLLSIPAMIGAGVVVINDLVNISNWNEYIPVILTGFFVSGLVGFFSIHWLLKYVTRHSLTIFVYYCIAISVISTLLFFIKGG
jgi:undecaprenyl-diphosphatase